MFAKKCTVLEVHIFVVYHRVIIGRTGIKGITRRFAILANFQKFQGKFLVVRNITGESKCHIFFLRILSSDCMWSVFTLLVGFLILQATNKQNKKQSIAQPTLPIVDLKVNSYYFRRRPFFLSPVTRKPVT
uniref:Putative ixodes 8-cys protein n=1 Tax=Ixodes ricinus TaxID=34613 RepID=A0A0K8RAT5_IXORI